VALPLEAGETVTIMWGRGFGSDFGQRNFRQFALYHGRSGRLVVEEFATSYPVISFEITLRPNAPAGEYSIRLQSPGGELAYLAGALTTILNGTLPASDFENRKRRSIASEGLALSGWWR